MFTLKTISEATNISPCGHGFHLRGGNYFSGSGTGVKTTIAKQPEMSSEDVVE